MCICEFFPVSVNQHSILGTMNYCQRVLTMEQKQQLFSGNLAWHFGPYSDPDFFNTMVTLVISNGLVRIRCSFHNGNVHHIRNKKMAHAQQYHSYVDHFLDSHGIMCHNAKTLTTMLLVAPINRLVGSTYQLLLIHTFLAECKISLVCHTSSSGCSLQFLGENEMLLDRI